MQFKHSFQLPELNLSQISLNLAIFLIPFQISLLVLESPSWGFGFFNSYASLKLYLFEIFIFLSGILFLISRIKEKRTFKFGHLSYYAIILMWMFLIFLSMSFQNVDPYFAFLISAHSTIFLILYFLIVNRVTSARSIVIAFVASMTFQAFLAIFQFILQGNLFFGFLGEPSLTEGSAHLAKMVLNGKEYIRAYGTLAHPNILGGFLALSILSTFFLTIKKGWLKVLLMSIQFAGLLFTFSRSALLGLTLSFLLLAFLYRSDLKAKSKLFTNIILGILSGELILVFILRWNELSRSVFERLGDFSEAINIFSNNPLGVGHRSYTLFMDQFADKALMPWDYQPVHNIFMLMLGELGIFGFIFAIWFFLFAILKLYEGKKKLLSKKRIQKKRLLLGALFIIAFTGFFDHYWISLEQGLAVLTLFFALASVFASEPSFARSVKKGLVIRKNQIDPTKNL